MNLARDERGMRMDLIKPTTLFYPSTAPTRRRRWRMHWASMASVTAAVLAGWMIYEVHAMHEQRRETQLRERHSPGTPERSTRLPAPSTPGPARLIRLQEASANSNRMLTARQ